MEIEPLYFDNMPHGGVVVIAGGAESGGRGKITRNESWRQGR